MTTTSPMIASIGKATTNNPAIANPVSIIGRSNRQKKNFDIPQQALMPSIIILKNTIIIAIINSMIIAAPPCLKIMSSVYVGIIICHFVIRLKSIYSEIAYSNLQKAISDT